MEILSEPNHSGPGQTYDEWIASRLSAIGQAEGRSFFWIVDGCADPDLLRLIKTTRETETWPLYMNTYLDKVRDAGPWFIRHQSGADLIHRLIRRMEQTPLGFLAVVRRGDEEILFDHLQLILECSMPDGGEGVFRYYDPRVLYGLNSFSDPEFMRLVCGPAMAIHFWEPGRSKPLSFQPEPGNYTPPAAPARLTTELIDHLWLEAQVHTIISTLGGEYGGKLRKMELPSAYGFVDGIRKLLSGTCYKSNQDVAFATALAIAEGLDYVKKIRKCLINQTPAESLEEVCRQIDMICNEAY
ncbi:hypothetical protein C4J81_00670 [Deltaproteobacteria bacterium Smac51]|nr:hypothetical protein C4J81_00670 [Deltaproteobacteria bacterium Smac51]